ncbi:MAG: hypothetical protein P8175_13625 [Deltaproteobacteria bacterium]|jgi:hypothetical protein
METAIFFLTLPLILFGVLFLSGSLVMRASHQVVDRFYSYGALDAARAKTLEELGLTPPDLFERMLRLRDYKPYALNALVKEDCVRVTREGKLYLVEKNLDDKLKEKES